MMQLLKNHCLAFAAMLFSALIGCSTPPKQGPGEELAFKGPAPFYASPEDAVVALITAAGRGDSAATAAALGPGASDLAADTPEETAGDLQRLANAYACGNELVLEEDGSVTLMLDKADRRWAFPIPIVRQNGRWTFDVAAGAQNVIDMRIARNETDAIRFTLALADAQRQYFDLKLGPDGTSVYAPKFLSKPGQRDGLYWPDELGTPRSPLGPIADAVERAGYNTGAEAGKPAPFLGYWYRILSFQGEHAPGGAQNYLDEDGLMTGGFALLAWPDQYGETGVNSFLVSSDGQVWQQDLGEDTAELVRELDGFDPGPGWERTDQF